MIRNSITDFTIFGRKTYFILVETGAILDKKMKTNFCYFYSFNKYMYSKLFGFMLKVIISSIQIYFLNMFLYNTQFTGIFYNEEPCFRNPKTSRGWLGHFNKMVFYPILVRFVKSFIVIWFRITFPFGKCVICIANKMLQS